MTDYLGTWALDAPCNRNKREDQLFLDIVSLHKMQADPETVDNLIMFRLSVDLAHMSDQEATNVFNEVSGIVFPSVAAKAPPPNHK